jgi:arabinogalactan oligomer/maltooligosaccharide transport system substrate-binding protein
MDIIHRFIITILILGGLTACATNVVENASITPPTETQVKTETEISTRANLEEIGDPLNTDEETEIEPTQVTPEPTPTSSEVIITFWHSMEGDGILALRDIILGFQRQESDIQVNLVYIPYDDLVDQYIFAVDKGEGPSIILGSGEWGHNLYDLEGSYDLTSGISDEFRSRINPPAMEIVSYRDAIVGLPFTISGGVLYRNASVVTEAPESFDALITAAQEVTTGEIVGAYLERGNLYAFPQITACEGSLLYPNGYPAFNNQAGICWLGLLESFNDAGAVANNTDDDLHRFIAGGVGIIIDGTWNLKMLEDALGDQLVIDPWPHYKNSHLSGFVWSETLYINPNLGADELNATRIFSHYLLSQEAQQKLSDYGYIPAITDLKAGNIILSQAIEALQLGTPYPVQPEFKLYFTPLSNVFQAVFKDGVDAGVALESATIEIIEAAGGFETLEGGE